MVSWRAWRCVELALFMLTLLHAPLTNLIIKVHVFISISEPLNSYLPIGLPGHNQTLSGLGYATGHKSRLLRSQYVASFSFTFHSLYDCVLLLFSIPIPSPYTFTYCTSFGKHN